MQYNKTVPCAVPACSQDNVHPIRVDFDKGGEVYSVDSSGEKIYRKESSARGVIIVISFQCEDGHFLEHHFQFHKGSTFTDTVTIEKREEWPSLQTIWRD